MRTFWKYSATGNDFILMDCRNLAMNPDSELVKTLCHRHFGIGGDGLVLIENSLKSDFKMTIYNADGSLAEMCGNATRASLHFAYHILKLKKESSFRFETMNGLYFGEVLGDEVTVEMTELYDIQKFDVKDLGEKKTYYLNTGVPHTIIEVENLEKYPVIMRGREVRYDPRFSKGTNVDFFEVLDAKKQKISLRIFERGVEGETLCCGTGVMATAIACSHFYGWEGEISVVTSGGETKAHVSQDFKKLSFSGKVKLVYTGEIDV